MAGQRDNPFLAIHLAHGFVENGRDNAAMDMSRWSLKAVRYTKFALDTGVVGCFLEAQMQSLPIFLCTAETVMNQARYRPIECVARFGSRLAIPLVRRGFQMASIRLDRTGLLLRDQFRDTLFKHGFVVVKNFHATIGFQQFLRAH